MPGAQELLVIALVAVFVLGPERLPVVARGAGRLVARIRNYGVTATKELRGVADLGGLQHEVDELRRELDRTRADMRRAMRETVAASGASPREGRPTDARESRPADAGERRPADVAPAPVSDATTGAGDERGPDTSA